MSEDSPTLADFDSPSQAVVSEEDVWEPSEFLTENRFRRIRLSPAGSISALAIQEGSNSKYEQALAYLDVDKDTDDRDLITTFELKNRETPLQIQLAQSALRIIATHRSSGFLWSYIRYGTSTSQEPLDITQKMSMQSGCRLKSTVFTINVGEDNAPFLVHEDIISQSPVLRALCQSNFKEGIEKHINMPDDDPKIFAMVLEYLYTKNDWIDKGDSVTKLRTYAKIFVMADKYQLEALKKSVISRIDDMVTGWASTSDMIPVSSFFSMMYHLYQNTHLPSTKHISIRIWFQRWAPVFLEQISDSDMAELASLIEDGGIFAADLFVIQNQGYVGAQGTSPNSHAWVVHRDKLQKAEEAIEVLREKHSKFHGDYRACDCKEFLLKHAASTETDSTVKNDWDLEFGDESNY